MGERQFKILASIVFVAIALLSLLLTIKNGTYKEFSTEEKSVEYTGGLDNLNPLERRIINELRKLTIPDSAIVSTFMIETETKDINVKVPKGKPMEEVIQVIQNAVHKTSYTLEDSHYSGKSDRARLIFKSSRKNKEDIILHLHRARHGYFKQNSSIVLIVKGIDTTSAETRLKYLNFDGILSYQVPVWTPELDSIAVVLSKYGSSLIVDLPLESKSRTKSTLYTVRIDDSKSSISSKLSELMRHAPTIAGISSHGGDLLLESRNVTSHFFEELKKRRLTFFDTRKNSQERARNIAVQKGLAYVRSNRKLKEKTTEGLTQELKKLCHTAGGRKQVIIWSEASSELIQALENSSEYFDKTGVSLIGVTALSNN